MPIKYHCSRDTCN